jgi:hypothetical protein
MVHPDLVDILVLMEHLVALLALLAQAVVVGLHSKASG